MNLIHITKDHPIYAELLTALDSDIFEKLKSRAEESEAYIPSTPEIDWIRFKQDYDNLEKGTAMAFVVISRRPPHSLRMALQRRGLKARSDYFLYILPILSVESAAILGRVPSDLISEQEFQDYACLSDKDWPDPNDHPKVAAIDQVVPRRSNRHNTADMLPQFKYMWQVYMVKTSDKMMAASPGKRGRPRKSTEA